MAVPGYAHACTPTNKCQLFVSFTILASGYFLQFNLFYTNITE